jgi:predicted RNA-binding Zn-ribbon protein involved in translation (DUF1610 family)
MENVTDVELCPHCATEVDITDKFEKQQCPFCKNMILPCSICTVNTCYSCPLEEK